MTYLLPHFGFVRHGQRGNGYETIQHEGLQLGKSSRWGFSASRLWLLEGFQETFQERWTLVNVLNGVAKACFIHYLKIVEMVFLGFHISSFGCVLLQLTNVEPQKLGRKINKVDDQKYPEMYQDHSRSIFKDFPWSSNLSDSHQFPMKKNHRAPTLLGADDLQEPSTRGLATDSECAGGVALRCCDALRALVMGS